MEKYKVLTQSRQFDSTWAQTRDAPREAHAEHLSSTTPVRKQVNKLILLHLISPRPPIHHSQTWISLMDNKVLGSHAGARVRIRFSNYSRLFSCNLTETDRSRRSGSETLVFVNSRSCLASIVSGFRWHDLCRETSGVTQRCHQWPANQTTWFCTVQESVATLPSLIQWIIPKNSLDL